MDSKSTVNMSIRINKELKKEADELFRDLGLNTSVAITMFLTQAVRDGSLPFTPTSDLPRRREKKHEVKFLKEKEEYNELL